MLNKSKEKEVNTSKNNKKKNIILIVVGVLLAIILFLLWFFNRKFEITFDYNNGTEEEIIYVKYNKNINSKDVKTKEDLGEQFIDWYLILEEKDGKVVLSDKPYDFKTKINKNIKLKAVYESKVETITVTFDSKGGSNIDAITINKGAELTLPSDPTYSGYTFKGWVDSNDNPIYDKVKLSEDTTLYAKWEKVEEKKEEPKKETPKPEEKKEEPEKETPKPEEKKEEPEKETPKPEEKKEESISLSLSNYYIHRTGTKTSKATASVENASGNVTYSVSSDRCISIDSNTGEISTKYVQKRELTYCAGGEKITVTATLPSGKSASQILNLEKDLWLTSGNNEYNYTYTNRYFSTGSNDFTVKANQSVKWTTSGTVDGSVTINDTTCVGTVNASTSSSATITATTVGGQKLDVFCQSVVN